MPPTLHNTSQCIKYRLGREIFRRNEVDEVFLPSFLLFFLWSVLFGEKLECQGAYSLYNFEDSRVGFLKVRGEHLWTLSNNEVLDQGAAVLCADSLNSQMSMSDIVLGTGSMRTDVRTGI